MYAGVFPLFLIVAWLAVQRAALHKIQVSVLGLFVSVILCTFITDVLKNAIGHPRPDLISRCRAVKGTPREALVGYKVCSQPNAHILQEGWRSFPSGHSSFAFSGFGYLSLYIFLHDVVCMYTSEADLLECRFLTGQLRVFRPRTDLFRCFLALAPLFGAVFISVSRLQDYRHDVYDVSCGAILGLLVARFSYRRYYPSLRSTLCDTPFQKPEMANGFTKVSADEEAGTREFPLRRSSEEVSHEA